jgi:endonuclease G
VFIYSAIGQTIEQKIETIENQILELDNQKVKALSDWELLKLEYVTSKLNDMGAPISNDSLQIVKHNALQLGYFERHEQASWVMHMVLPDVTTGNVSRTNDFREDPLVTTGTSVKDDYWYSGYDRGHLAPSADFRWSQIALSESYFYSNMSPQLPELNREKWAELENAIRDYVIQYKDEVYVITGPILNDTLPSMKNEGRKNEVTIPNLFYKVVLDISGDTTMGIAFVMPNGHCGYPALSYATSIDKVEELTGLDFFASLDDDLEDKLESNTDVTLFNTRGSEGEILPINPTTLPKGKINTVQAQYNIGTKSCVCGTVVSTKFSEKSGATFLNLDKKFPNQIFSVTIWSKAISNFSYKPEDELYGKKVCVTGMLESKDGTPTMNVTNEKNIEIIEDEIEK